MRRLSESSWWTNIIAAGKRREVRRRSGGGEFHLLPLCEENNTAVVRVDVSEALTEG